MDLADALASNSKAEPERPVEIVEQAARNRLRGHAPDEEVARLRAGEHKLLVGGEAEAVERRRRAKEQKGATAAQREHAAEVIQASGRMYLAVRGRERQEQLAQMRALRDAADEEGNNWARAQRQFQNAQMGNAFAGMADPRKVNLTKASW